MNFDEIVQIVLKEVMSQLENKSFISKKAVVFFTGNTVGLEECITELEKLKIQGIKLKAVLSKHASQIIDRNIINKIFNNEDIYIDGDLEDSNHIYDEEFDLLIGATLSINSLSKVANGISDTMPTALISKCILSGTKVIISKEGVEFRESNIRKNPYKNIPVPYMNMIKGYLDRLESYGIKFVNSENIFDSIIKKDFNEDILPKVKSKIDDGNINEIVSSNFKNEFNENYKTLEFKINKKVISSEDISNNSGNKKIVIPSNSIITSLAKDLSEELGIQIIKR
ncbi:phosphopantothenate--cysteine ligase [Clostridium botulinum]|uniref:Phosphopantothenate--cysteine ligase n=1 Tax=Clostridium botulinum TaxID=1491 RepID=A0A0L9YB41_CLOBO|nr:MULTISPECIES: flavoprotein [Clostridium]ACD52532.1 putative phosphopantothenate--cysteine ligase [Clostridium botulinum E3 str. Alaska E43]AJF29799.1 phosphopantothenate--cysteine ligase [Clostridium botulinum]AJF32860.1 phosphopantothenate--cysteine ligase [Clostridium botulinum]KOM88679.1 phosphopantothenate--cysteine ligase [Clostridium botulinum]KOR57515.1 phosphopantothenate--cysteine ligase [Clostridium botulinum]